MYYFSQKKFFRIALCLNLFVVVSGTVFSQTKADPTLPKFLILIETTANGIKLTGEQGCAWKQLILPLNQGQPQAVDQYGTASLDAGKPGENRNLPNFLFTIKTTKSGVSLEGKKGTAWTNLKFSCPKGKCYQYINF